jgi:hypothetical protein
MKLSAWYETLNVSDSGEPPRGPYELGTASYVADRAARIDGRNDMRSHN